MPIDIKEIFKSDLDPNSLAWFSSKKVDKLNHNFNQLSEGGNPGPLGEKGADGNYGIKGLKGGLGNQGYLGFQGDKGEFGESTWIYVDGQSNRTVFPNQPPQLQSFSPQSVKIGLNSNLSEYSQSIGTDGAVLSIHSSAYGGNVGNSRDSISFFYNSSKISKLYVTPDTSTQTAGDAKLIEDTIGGNREWYINEIDFTNPSANSVFKVVANVGSYLPGDLRFLAPTEFNSSAVQHNDTVKLTSGAPDDKKVLVAVDSTGLVQWQNKNSVFRSLPFGSIISIKKAEWNSTNFEFYGTIDVGNSPNQTPLHNTFGRGKGEFEGWYVCNGENWTNGTPAIEYEVPNLNSFDYVIEPNDDNTQNAIANGGNNDPVLIGGIDVDMNSTFNAGYLDDYETQLTSDNSDGSMIVNSPQYGTARAVVNVLWIVYLENPNLYWINASSVSTVNLSPITGFNTSSTSTGACDPSTDPNAQQNQTLYINPWDPSTDDWTDSNLNTSGLYLYTDAGAQNLAPSQWYALNGAARFWDGASSFTQFSQCQLSFTVQIENSIIDLNGDSANLTGATVVQIDTSSFETATTMYFPNQGNTAGWYRRSDISGTARRYWNGGNFVGHAFTEDYVYFVGQYQFSNYYGSGICTELSNFQNSFNTWIATNTPNPYAGISNWDQPESAYLYLIDGQTLYVDSTYTFQQINEEPLGTKIIHKAKEGGSPVAGRNSLRGANIQGTDYSTLNSSSTVNYQGVCPVVDNKLYQQQSNGSYTQVGDIVETVDNTNLTLDSFDGRISKNNTTGAGGGPGLKLTVEVPPIDLSGPAQSCFLDNSGNPTSSIIIDFTCNDGTGNMVFDHQQNYINSGSSTQTFTAFIGDAEMNLTSLGDYDFTCIYATSCMNDVGEITIELDPT